MKYFQILFFVFPFLVFSQQKTLAKFIITDASLNKNDVTETYLDAGGYIVFYTNDEGNLYMANVMSERDTQSFGRLYSSEHSELKETYDKYEADIFYFNWSYKNDYDSKRGTAKVKLVKIYKPQGIIFSCIIIPENLDILEYKGYMEGSVDFSKF
jgi:hypothetical protein